jgi:hypothetical protein
VPDPSGITCLVSVSEDAVIVIDGREGKLAGAAPVDGASRPPSATARVRWPSNDRAQLYSTTTGVSPPKLVVDALA